MNHVGQREKELITHLILDFVQLCPKRPKTRMFLESSRLTWVYQHDLRLSTYDLSTHSQQRLLPAFDFYPGSSRARFSHLVHKQRKFQISVLVDSRVEQNFEVPVRRIL
jgi:hypothetical protein